MTGNASQNPECISLSGHNVCICPCRSLLHNGCHFSNLIIIFTTVVCRYKLFLDNLHEKILKDNN